MGGCHAKVATHCQIEKGTTPLMSTALADAPTPVRNGSHLASGPTPRTSAAGARRAEQTVPAPEVIEPSSETGGGSWWKAMCARWRQTSADEWFLRGWLLFAAAVSIAANIGHALFMAPEGLTVWAAVASIFPPVFVVGSTHVAVIQAKERRFGWGFAFMLLPTVLLAACAFRLSYQSISDLAIMLGTPAGLAGLWPIALDISMVNSTLALFMVTRPQPQAALPSETEPLSLGQRRFWWEQCATVLKERNEDVKPITEHSIDEIAEVLQLTYDERDPQAKITEVTGLNRREVRAIQHGGAELFESFENRAN